MRIGIDARLWQETGVGRYIRNLVTHLQEIDKKNDYTLFVNKRDASVVSQTLKSSHWKLISTHVHWHSFREQVQFPFQLYKEHIDLMHFPYFSLPVLYKRPFVITVHDLIIHHFSTGKASTLPLPLYTMKRIGYKTVLQQAIKHAKQIIVPLHATKLDLQNTLSVPDKNITVTYEGVDTRITSSEKDSIPGFEKKQKYFLYVGNAYPHKNLPALLAAFRLFRQKYPNEPVLLFLVGKEDFFYAQLRDQLKNMSDIHVFHNVPDDILHNLYAHAVALVAPSFMEGFGLVPLEALASGCLVVASDIPSHQEVCGDAAIYFDPKRTEDLLFALENVYHISGDAKKKLTEKGRERLQDFSWKTMAQQTLDVYLDAAPTMPSD